METSARDTTRISPRVTVTVGEAAEQLGIGRGLAYALVRSGQLPSVRLGARRLVIAQAQIDALLAGKR